jgi:hypothetical protein
MDIPVICEIYLSSLFWLVYNYSIVIYFLIFVAIRGAIQRRW